MIDLEVVFEKRGDELHRFGLIESPAHPRPDVCAFLLLHELAPREKWLNMILAAGSDQIWLDVDLAALADSATEDQIVTLIRCGVMLDRETGSLSMYV